MPHNRSPTGTEKRKQKKTLRHQAKTFLRQNSFTDLENGETSNLASPYEVKLFLEEKSSTLEVKIKIINPYLYGSLIDFQEGFLVQAAQGLVSEALLTH